MKDLIRTIEQRIGKAHADVWRTFQDRDRDDHGHKQWQKACEVFHRVVNEGTYPGGLEEELGKLKEADPAAVETAIEFLEVDPTYFRSGYIKEDLIRRLKQLDLSEEQCGRLRKVVLSVVDTGARREFRRYCHLAAKVKDADFIAQLQERSRAGDPGVKRRAIWVLQACEE